MQQVPWLRIGEGDQYRGNCTTRRMTRMTRRKIEVKWFKWVIGFM